MNSTGTQTVPAGYKQTEVGVIPNDWNVEELNNIVDFKNGKAHENFVVENGKYIVVNSKFISTEGEVVKYSNEYYCPTEKDSILMVMSDVPNGRAIAKCFLVDENNKYTVNQRICSLKPKIDPKFLFYKLDRNPYFLSFDDGVKQTNLRKDDILVCKLGMPTSLLEQSSIGNVLYNLNVLIQKTEKLIAKKRAIKQGAMQELLTGKRRLPGFSGEWEEKKLGDMAEFYKGRGLTKSDISDDGQNKSIHYGELFTKYTEEITNILSYTDISGDYFYSKVNDTLMPTSDVTPNGLATASCIKEDGVLLGGDILVIRPNSNLDGIYLSYCVANNRDQIMQLVTGITVFHLYASYMKKFTFKLPKLEEQHAIVKVFSEMQTEIEKLEQKLGKYNQIKQGAMQVLLTGKIRLIRN